MPAAFSGGHLAPKGDVPGTIQVSIEGEMAFLAFEQALMLAVAFFNVPALGATLAGMLGVNLDHQASLCLRLVTEHELQPAKRPRVQHRPALLPQPAVPNPVQILHREDVAGTKSRDDLLADAMEHVADKAVFPAMKLGKVSFAGVSLSLELSPCVPILQGGVGQDAATEEPVLARDRRSLDADVHPDDLPGLDRVWRIVLDDHVQEDLVVLDDKVGRLLPPGGERLVILGNLKLELGTLVRKADRDPVLGEPDVVTPHVQPDRAEPGLWTRRPLALLDPGFDGEQGLGRLDPGRAGELGRQAEGFACRISLVVQADAIGIGVGPADLANEVEGFGVGVERREDVVRGRGDGESDGSRQSHNMSYGIVSG